jgi:multiple RNA-binding domain-containing protein 1
MVRFEDSECAVSAFQASDGIAFQGRLLHILPAAVKREQTLDEFSLAKLPLKTQNLLRKRAEAATNSFNWNSLFMNQDAVNTSVANRLGVSKSDLLDPTSADAGVKQAMYVYSLLHPLLHRGITNADANVTQTPVRKHLSSRRQNRTS